MSQILQVPPLARGYHYPLLVHVTCDDAPFPAGATIVAQLRDYAGGPLAAQLTTADGSLTRVDDHSIELQVPAAATALLGNTTASIDFVRIDADSQVEWLGLRITLPELAPVTIVGSAVLGGFGASAAGATTAIVVCPPDWSVRLTHCAPRAEASAQPAPTTTNTPSNSTLAAASVPGLGSAATTLDARLTALGA